MTCYVAQVGWLQDHDPPASGFPSAPFISMCHPPYLA